MFVVDVLTFGCTRCNSGGTGVALAYQPEIQVMQFTGLKDKNGKEIYEGDVVQTRFADTDLVGTIKYADKWARFYFAAPNKHGCPIAFEPETVFCWYYGEDDEEGTSICEIIGNIYENPELINE